MKPADIVPVPGAMARLWRARLEILRRPPRGLWVLLALSVALYLGYSLHYSGDLVDDTFISLRYARNLAEGEGLVFNPGERVEGYTNFLLVLFAALLIRLGLDPIAGTVALALGMALVGLYYLRRLETGDRAGAADPSLPPLALTLVLCLPAFAYWSISGLETMLFSALLLAAVHVSAREEVPGPLSWRRQRAVWVFVVLALVRPEGALAFAACTAGFVLAAWLREDGGLRASLKRHAANAAIFTLAYGAYFLWRFTYYGHLFPNTFYAKATGAEGQFVDGLRYVALWARTFPFLALASLWPFLLAARRWRTILLAKPAALPSAVISLAFVLYVGYIGGDWMDFFRFLFPVLLLNALLWAWVFRTGRREGFGPRWRWCFRLRTVAAVWAVTAVCAALTDHAERAFVASRIATVGLEVGEWLRREFPPDTLLALNTAGAVPYASRLPALDMLGLTDEKIAHRPVFVISPGWAGHRRGWGEYILGRKPRILLFCHTAGAPFPYYLSDRELAEEPAFRFFYRLKSVVLRRDSGGEGRVLARFLGAPFGRPALARTHLDLGFVVRFEPGPWPHTVIRESPAFVHYFEFEEDAEALWEHRKELRENPARFIDRALVRWREAQASAPPADPAARAEVERLCQRAYERLKSGEAEAARAILMAALARNGEARSPLPWQYLANLHVLKGELFWAVSAQQEALKLDPGNVAYRANLQALLLRPYNDWQQRSPVAKQGAK